MIDFIDGEIVFIYPEAIVVKAGGIGYRIYCSSPQTFGQEGDEVRVFTYQHVREDALTLYGFKSKEERELFRCLLGVSGVGPKGALSILSADDALAVVQAIYNENITFLTQFPGIGKKTAQRIIFELKDKLELDVWLNELIAAGQSLDGPSPATAADETAREAIEALIQLGYNESEARSAVSEAKVQSGGVDLSVNALIKRALQTFLS